MPCQHTWSLIERRPRQALRKTSCTAAEQPTEVDQGKEVSGRCRESDDQVRKKPSDQTCCLGPQTTEPYGTSQHSAACLLSRPACVVLDWCIRIRSARVHSLGMDGQYTYHSTTAVAAIIAAAVLRLGRRSVLRPSTTEDRSGPADSAEDRGGLSLISRRPDRSMYLPVSGASAL